MVKKYILILIKKYILVWVISSLLLNIYYHYFEKPHVKPFRDTTPSSVTFHRRTYCASPCRCDLSGARDKNNLIAASSASCLLTATFATNQRWSTNITYYWQGGEGVPFQQCTTQLATTFLKLKSSEVNSKSDRIAWEIFFNHFHSEENFEPLFNHTNCDEAFNSLLQST